MLSAQAASHVNMHTVYGNEIKFWWARFLNSRAPKETAVRTNFTMTFHELFGTKGWEIQLARGYPWRHGSISVPLFRQLNVNGIQKFVIPKSHFSLLLFNRQMQTGFTEQRSVYKWQEYFVKSTHTPLTTSISTAAQFRFHQCYSVSLQWISLKGVVKCNYTIFCNPFQV